jgi:membrane protein implicated in regulation of membrane protease activity
VFRACIAGLGIVLICGAAVLVIAVPRAWPGSVELFVFGALLLAGIFFERHYRGRAATNTKGLQETGERFVDPTTGKLTEVLYDPQTGERVYRVL